MREPFTLRPDDDVRVAVERAWGRALDPLTPCLEGAGAHHWWTVAGGRRLFVTCDDLDTKPWLGRTRDEVFAGLQATYGAAVVLRDQGRPFVAAPIPALDGAPAVRLDDRLALSVLDHVDGVPGQWGERLRDDEIDELVVHLADLHRCHPGSLAGLGTAGIDVANRGQVERALAEVDQPWTGGPLAEEARAAVAAAAETIAGWLDRLDACRAAVAPEGFVVSHGEPHPGNVIRTGDGLVLLDWDTVALAPPERDLWMLVEVRPTAAADYEARTGVALRPAVLEAYRLVWTVADVAFGLTELRADHTAESADNALRYLRAVLDGWAPAPYGLAPNGQTLP